MEIMWLFKIIIHEPTLALSLVYRFFGEWLLLAHGLLIYFSGYDFIYILDNAHINCQGSRGLWLHTGFKCLLNLNMSLTHSHCSLHSVWHSHFSRHLSLMQPYHCPRRDIKGEMKVYYKYFQVLTLTDITLCLTIVQGEILKERWK